MAHVDYLSSLSMDSIKIYKWKIMAELRLMIGKEMELPLHFKSEMFPW